MKGEASSRSRLGTVSSWLLAGTLAFGTLVHAASAPQVQPSAALQIQALKTIKATKTSQQNKIDSRLYMALLHQHQDSRLAALPDFRFVQPQADGRVPVEIVLANVAAMKPTLAALAQHDDVVQFGVHQHGNIQARVHLADLEDLAAINGVRKIRTPLPRYTNAVNTSEGDATHGADVARSTYGITGAGVKVCVLSDGVDSLASLQASGDLPPTVDVLPGQAGSGDEGSAMLEIVHDLAPGAALGFAQAGPDEAGFAQNILDLATAGCNVIVDDVIYLDESPFEDGAVAQSVNTVTAAGVLYFSSAGNEGNADDLTSGTWEGDFAASAATPPAPLAGATLHDFGDGGNSILVEFGGGNPPLLIWAEHYDLNSGSASTDFDLYDMDGGLTTVFDASNDVQDGTGGDDFPIEFIGGGTFGGERLLIERVASGTTSSVPMFNLIVFRGELDDNLATNGATRGHSAAAAAFSVAATPAAASFDGVSADGPYPGQFTTANVSESFSSDGVRRLIMDPTGAELTPGNRTSTGGVVRQKPDITAADGVSTAAPGFNPFYGTSAAAPHAAAIAALLKSSVPSLTPAQVRTALLSTALDIEAPGVDRDTGAGIVMPGPALVSVGAVPNAYLDFGTAVPTQVAGDGDSAIEPNEIFDLDIPLTNNGGAAATAISAVLTTSTPNVTILAPNSTYPDLAPAASASNATAYRFRVGDVPCGSSIDFTLTVTYTGGASPTQSTSFSIGTGSAGAPQTFTYAGAVVPIPDSAGSNVPGTPATADLPVSGFTSGVNAVRFHIDGATCDANAGSTGVGIDHSFVNDLQLTLRSPTGTAVVISNRVDGGGNNFCQTVFDDTSATPIGGVVTTDAPFSNTYSPSNSLGAFKGEDPNGTWQLEATDFFTGDTGNIRAFGMDVTPAVCDAPPLVATVTGAKTVSGTFAVGGTVTYTITLSNSGNADAGDNAGNEFTDVLPSALTLVSASATSGTAVATVGTNTVTWNGTVPAAGSVTITVTATINSGVTDGTAVANQGSISYDSDGDGSNDASAVTDDPSTGTANDSTGFTVAQGQLNVTPATLPFGDVVVGATSAPLSITLSNVGSVSLNVNSLTAAAAPFAVTSGTCSSTTPPITIAAGASCTLDYTYSPTATGANSQTIDISADAPGTGSVQLSGNGVQPVLNLSSNTLDFGTVVVGSAPTSQTLTISNTGTGDLTVTAIPAPSAPFSVTGGTCAATPFTLAAGASCTVIYTLTPNTAGTFSQPVAIASNGGSATVTLNAVVGVPAQQVAVPTLSGLGRLLLLLSVVGLAGLALRRRLQN